MIRDRNLDWKRLRHVIPWTEFGAITASTTTVSGIGTGAPPSAQISTFSLTGLNMEVSDDAGAWDWKTPTLADVTQPIGVRVLYTINAASPTATDSVTWKVLYDQVDPGEAIIKPATALDTAIAAQDDGGTTGFLYRVSSRGVINADTLDFTAKTGVMSWLVEPDAVTDYAAAEIVFLGLEIDYIPRLTLSGAEDVDVHSSVAATN